MTFRPRRRLAFLVWGLGLANIALVVAVIAVMVQSRPRRERDAGEEHMQALASLLAEKATDRAALEADLRRFSDVANSYASATFPDGSRSGSTSDEGNRPGLIRTATVTTGPLAGTKIDVGFLRPVNVVTALSTVAIVVFACVGLTSFVAARWLAKPLAALADAARAFGDGNLSVRARLRRRDELGDVAVAFDDMADRIERLVRAQRELVANVSHELRTPLARIQVSLDLASEGGADMARDSLREIAEDLTELETLVDDLLTLARLEVGALPGGSLTLLHLEPTPLRTVCEKATAKFRIRHPQRTLDVVLSELPVREIDPVLLRRALDNLLENAAKYSPPDQPIRFEARCDASATCFAVTDRGEGISAADLPHVFEPFFRADRARTKSGPGGVGLGLSLVKGIVDAHGGSVSLAAADGGGTCATVVLPA